MSQYLSEEQRDKIISTGSAARRLLSMGDFVAVVNDLANEATTAMSDTPIGPTGAVDRDQHHAMLHALRAVYDAVKGQDRALAMLEADEAEPAEPDADELS